MRNNPEYSLYKQIATYLLYQYPNVLYHFDPTGLNLSKTQSGMLKAIQGGRGFPDLFIVEPRAYLHGLMIEIKVEGTRIYKKDGITPTTPHIAEQLQFINSLASRMYYARMCVGFYHIKSVIDEYLKMR